MQKGNDEAREVLAMFHHVFDSPEGKIVLENLEKMCDINTVTFNPNNDYYSLGKRSVIKTIKAILDKPLKKGSKDE